MNISQAMRLIWIDHHVRGNLLNRSDLINAFGVSPPQASIDITKFRMRHPGRLVYDTSRRCYYGAGKAVYPLAAGLAVTDAASCAKRALWRMENSNEQQEKDHG